MPWDPPRQGLEADHIPSSPADILKLVNDQAQLLAAIAGGRLRDPELDREYWVRARALRIALAPLDIPDPFPFRDLSAWVAQCRLHHPNAISSHARIEELAGPVRRMLQEIAA
jgi:hypothetical protein